MKVRTLLLLTTAAMMAAACSQTKQMDKEELLSQMSIEDKAHLAIGTGMAGLGNTNSPTIGATKKLVPGAAGTTYPLDSLGIPSIVLSDGPAGLRIDPKREGDKNTYYCTHFPIGTLLASTWDQQLVEEVGKAIGNEVKEYGADVLLAPGMNIHRNPLNGRNFEYYSEDPVVAGLTAAAYVNGVQSNGVGTSVKHFFGNNQETNRINNDAHISQRAIREIYLKPFEIAIKKSNPWTVMTSYNHVNGKYTSEDKELLQTILRDEWGYKGMVMTDWLGGFDAAQQMRAGNDMLQPGKAGQFESIVKALSDGSLKMEDMDRNIGRILDLIQKTPKWAGYKYSNKPDLKAHAKITRQSATEGMVLLENKQNTLPLDKNIKNVCIYGCTSYQFIAGGTGSGNVNHAYVVSLLDGFKNAGYNYDADLQKKYEDYIKVSAEKYEADMKAMEKKDPGKYMLARFLPTPLPAEMTIDEAKIKADAQKQDVAVITFGRLSGEFVDRFTNDFELSSAEKDLLNKVCEAYHAVGKKVVVLLNIGGVIETASWKNQPDAILCAWQAGQEGGNSVVDVLNGKANPSGKLTMTWPVKYTDVYSSKNFPVDQAANLKFVADGKVHRDVKNVDYTDYEEDIYVGYRYFDSFNVPVSYPFGYGLSYTNFEYSNAKVSQKGDEYNVSVEIKNTGKTAGKEVVELYVAAPNSKENNKPVKELKAYAKTALLNAGEKAVVTLTVNASDLASYDEDNSQWKVDEGEYQFLVAASSRDIKATLSAKVEGAIEKVNDVLKPNVKLNLLRR